MLSQYLKSFMNVFTEKTNINKGTPGLSLGKQVTEELSKCFLPVRGTRILWTQFIISRSPSNSQVCVKRSPNLPRGTTAWSSILLSWTCHGQLLPADPGSNVYGLRIQGGKRSVSHRSSAAAHKALAWNFPIIVKGPMRRTNKPCHVS